MGFSDGLADGETEPSPTGTPVAEGIGPEKTIEDPGQMFGNIARTAPYMYDGRFTTLEEVVAHYNHGMPPNPNLDPNLAKHPAEGLQLSDADQRALVAFLKALTEEPQGSRQDPKLPDSSSAQR